MNSVQVKQDILLNKSLEELAPLIEVGQAVYAHTGKLGDISIYRRAPGQYSYCLEWLRMNIGWDSEKGEKHTLASFLEGIDFDNAYGGEHKEEVQEMKEVLTKPIWSNIDEASYNMLLHEEEIQQTVQSAAARSAHYSAVSQGDRENTMDVYLSH